MIGDARARFSIKFYVVAVLGVLFGGIAFFMRMVGGLHLDPVSWRWPIMLGMAVYRAAVVPKGSLTIYDPVLNRFETISDIPDGVVLVAGTLNKIERGLVEIIDTAAAPTAKYAQGAGGIGFTAVRHIMDADIKNAYLKQSLGRYMGAIGQGLPNALGAALACPDRRVIAFQADGSGLYTLQALWSMARESANVTVVVCANRCYRILQAELARSGVAEPGPKAHSLTDLTQPVIEWASLAKGFGVPACSVQTDSELAGALMRSFAEPGPSLIEAVLMQDKGVYRFVDYVSFGPFNYKPNLEEVG